MVRRACAVLGSIGLLAVALAACGSSSSKSSSTTSPTPASTPVASPTTGSSTASATGSATGSASVHGTAFRLGTVSSCSGPEASGVGGACPTITAWADWVNAHGGINGHPVKMTVLDDAGNPATSLTDLKKLIAQDHVQAIVGEYSLDDATWVSYINSSGVPVVGGGSSEPPFATSPDFFASGGQQTAYQYAQAAVAKRHGDSKLGMIVCAEAPTCATDAVITGAMIKGGLLPGQQLDYSTKILATAPSFTAECLAAKAKGVQALLVNDAGAITQRVVDQCAQQGYKPTLMAGGGVLNPVLAADPNFAGIIDADSNPPLSDVSSGSTRTLLAALQRYAPSLTSSNEQWNATVPEVWSGGLLFQAAAQAGHLTPSSTPQQVKQALYAIKGTTLGGEAPTSLSFKPGQVTAVNCAFIESAQNGKPTTSVYGTKPVCFSGDASSYLALLK